MDRLSPPDGRPGLVAERFERKARKELFLSPFSCLRGLRWRWHGNCCEILAKKFAPGRQVRHCIEFMLTALTSQVRYSVTERRLVTAFGISLTFHLLLFGVYLVAPAAVRATERIFLPFITALAPKTVPQKPPPADPKRALAETKKPKAEPKLREIPMTYVEVDPALAVLDPPKNAKYYSSQSTLAANPDFSKVAPLPKIQGKQDKIPRLADVPKFNPQPLQPTPKPQPPEPPPPQTAQTSPPPKPVEPNPPEPPAPKSTIGDLAMARPPERTAPPKVAETPRWSTGRWDPKAAAPAERERPRTLAQAARQDPRLAGQLMSQEGGVARRGHISVDAAASPFGDYDREFIETVEACWFKLLEDATYMMDRHGKVVVEFRLHPDGRVSQVIMSYQNVGEILARRCQSAIEIPSPYKPWPGEMRLAVGADHRDVRFTFYYD